MQWNSISRNERFKIAHKLFYFLKKLAQNVNTQLETDAGTYLVLLVKNLR